MDHLPDVNNPAYPLDDVPFFIVDPSDQYTGPGLLEFPKTRGMILGQHLDEQLDTWTLYYQSPGQDNALNTSEQAAAFFQAWLFFGPLLEVFSILDLDVQLGDFVCERDGKQLITTSSLQDLTSRWARTENEALDTEGKTRRGERISEILETADALLRNNLCNNNAYKSLWAVPEVIVVSIQLVLEALTHAWGTIYPDPDMIVVETGGGIWADTANTRMLAQGWCSSEITLAEHFFSATGRYFASRLKRPAVPGRLHGSCNKAKCVASQVDKATYSTRHVESDCKCSHLSVDICRVTQILDSGKVPVIRIHPLKDKNIPRRLTVESSGRYVAVSHVWAQGLGNAHTNSLPTCQLSRLHELALGVLRSAGHVCEQEGSVAIWIDTLCVPLGDGRKQALRLMGQTYANATCVLVLDEELCHQTYHCSQEERCIRLFLCPWSRRLWTFKEGFIAGSRLFVQFKEGPLPFSDLTPDYRKTWHSPLLYHSLTAAWSVLPRRNASLSEGEDVLRLVTDACKYRTTSWLPDETYCLAETAGLEVDAILKDDTQEGRMKAFLLECKNIPADVVFFDGPKLHEPGFRWAPYSFLYPSPSDTILGGSRQGSCSVDGLTATWPSYALTFPVEFPYASASLYYFSCNGKWMSIESPELIQERLHNETPEIPKVELFRQLSSVPQSALIVNGSDPWDHSAAIISDTSLGVKCSGTDGALIAEFVINVFVNSHDLDDDVFNPDLLDPMKCIPIEGTPIGNTAWCIS